MRVIAEIPHPRFKVTVFSWNAKYIVKVEIDEYEQTFKLKEEDVEGLDQIRALFNEEFLNGCMQRFLSMRTDLVQGYQRVTQSHNE